MGGDVIKRSCQGLEEANACYLVFPTDQNTVSYDQGYVRLIHLNTYGEPAGGASHLMVVNRSEQHQDFECALISYSRAVSFRHIDLTSAKADLDHHTWNVAIPVEIFDGEKDVSKILKISINKRTGHVEASPLIAEE